MYTVTKVEGFTIDNADETSFVHIVPPQFSPPYDGEIPSIDIDNDIEVVHSMNAKIEMLYIPVLIYTSKTKAKQLLTKEIWEQIPIDSPFILHSAASPFEIVNKEGDTWEFLEAKDRVSSHERYYNNRLILSFIEQDEKAINCITLAQDANILGWVTMQGSEPYLLFESKLKESLYKTPIPITGWVCNHVSTCEFLLGRMDSQQDEIKLFAHDDPQDYRVDNLHVITPMIKYLDKHYPQIYIAT